MRHQTGLNRATKRSEKQDSYVCEYDDCRRVLWVQVIGENPESIDYVGCLECGREAEYKSIDAPDDTIMLDDNDDPIPKSEEKEIPVVEPDK